METIYSPYISQVWTSAGLGTCPGPRAWATDVLFYSIKITITIAISR